MNVNIYVYICKYVYMYICVAYIIYINQRMSSHPQKDRNVSLHYFDWDLLFYRFSGRLFV